MNHRYTAYGYTIDSEVRLPELVRTNSHRSPDIVIQVRSEQSKDLHTSQHSEPMEVRKGTVISRPEFTFRVIAGSRIEIEPSVQSIGERERHFILGIGFGCLMNQRGDLLFNSSAIQRDGRAVALLGVENAGKSSVAAALCKRGYGLVSDSLLRYESQENEALTFPGFPCIKLNQDTASELASGHDPVSSDINHYRQYYRFNKGFSLRRPQLSQILVLKKQDGDTIRSVDSVREKREHLETHRFAKDAPKSLSIKNETLCEVPMYTVPQGIGSCPRAVASHIDKIIPI